MPASADEKIIHGYRMFKILRRGGDMDDLHGTDPANGPYV